MSDEEHAILFDKFEKVEARVRAVETKLAFGAGIIVTVQILGMIALGAWL